MALNIKNLETERLTAELAQVTGESLTTAVTVAVSERLERLRRGEISADQRIERILSLGKAINVRLPKATMTVEDLYDPETGLPA